MAKSYGWAGKVLWVNLTERKVTMEPTSDFEPEKFLGGVGLNTKIFWELGSPKVNAFHPDSPLMISIGPMTGASGPFNRSEVCGIAPQTYPKELFSYSGFGGKFSSELKYAGYDGIVIIGKADKPVYLAVLDDDVQIKDAGHLWGLDTFETQKAVMSAHPDASVLTIGPAGENRSRVAIILNETASAAGQGGYGAVMGSKNLKAIALKGTGTLKIANPDYFMNLLSARKASREWKTSGHQSWGRYPLGGEEIREEMVDKHLKRFAGCHGCPFQCMGFYDIPGIGAGGQMCVEAWYGFYSGGSSEGMWEGNIMSQKLGINNYEMHGLMDFIIAGVRGRAFTNDDLGLPFIPIRDYSFERKYGGQEKHHQFLQALLGGIADGTSPFHQGVARAAEQLGERAVRVYDTLYPAQGMRTHHIEGIGAALHRATDTRDPFDSCHDYTSCFGVNSYVARHFGVPGGYMNPSKNIYDGAEKETVWVQSHQSIKNSMPICDYASIPSLFFHPPQLDIRIFESQLISAVTGIEMDADKLWATGQRIWTLRRAIMALRENRTRDDDTLSHVWFERIPAGGQVLAKPIDTDEWEALKDRYYTLLGYNVSNGLPTRTILEGLGMKGVADELQKAGKLG